ncbi:hypothetical protein PoB_000062400 [Plakobranchus ocellatus]|uniref:Uncharacterized protein n=1 Tax=Plakobranchus ocellatus TaxID=259542 RepID=A0AAV3XW18_9GAST|nr:hypothetical protein PoB_000062400 [Plakobranchus ocellatus]
MEDIVESSDSYETESESSAHESSTPTPKPHPLPNHQLLVKLPPPAPSVQSDWCAAEPGLETASHFRFLPAHPPGV